jgi:hypothetical protein
VRDVERIRRHTGLGSIVQSALLGHPIHTLSYTVLSPTPPQKRKLTDGQF